MAPFEAYLSGEGLPYLSLQEAFDREKGGARLTYRHSHHFNAEGHEFIFRHLEAFLLDTQEVLN
ncbi:MAG: hypothetical protein D6743_07945 [Calditrichaeota bacterium]|nr:MAG: hypothetical protein D6743_07945 [Calditrichota bacterium]